jgi:hypothetical protein
MLNEQTVEKLMGMHLKSMARIFREQVSDPTYVGLSFENSFGMIVDKQWSDRKSNNISRLIKRATLKMPSASIEDIEHYPNSKLDKDLIILLTISKYIKMSIM